MVKVRFNNTDLDVSPICLGTVGFGTALSKADARNQLSQFFALGGNFIDTAHIYGDWEPGLRGRSERIIGEWMREGRHRDQAVISTKGAHPEWGRLTSPRLSPREIEKDLNKSLEYLNTDYIDLYFLHRDDRNIPVPEIIDFLESAVKCGKIKYYGCSNWSLERIKEAAAYAAKNGVQGFAVNQLMWSLADVNFNNLADKSFVLMDRDTHDYHSQSGLNAMAYMSAAKAYFTRVYAGSALPQELTDIYENESNRLIYDKALSSVESGEYRFIHLSLMYLMSQKKFPTVPIVSFSNQRQMNEGLESWNMSQPDSLLFELSSLKKFIYQ